MAVPEMIGQADASIFYSGSQTAFEHYRPVFDVIAHSRYFGSDAGAAALHDLALMAGMYTTFAGFVHGAAMVATAGLSAKEFAAMAGPWLGSMSETFDFYAEFIDAGDYRTDIQSLDFTKSAVDLIVKASRDENVGFDVLAPIQRLIDAQIDDGHGVDVFARIYEGIKQP